jgi:hypothetical protein
MTICYRLFLVVSVVLVASSSLIAQIPNAGFESWTNGDPDGWTVTNSDPIFTITQTTSAHSGTYAAHGAVFDAGVGSTLAPIMFSGTSGNEGFPVDQRYGALHGFYKFSPTGGDRLFIEVIMQKDTAAIGVGMYLDTATVTTYREFVANISYVTGDVPDTGWIYIAVTPQSGPFTHLGTTFDIDDLSFGPATGVNDLPNGRPASYRLEQNFPNPFNPSTGIVYDLPEQSNVRLTVYNLIGQQVAVLVNEAQPAGRYKAIFDGSNLTSGMYFYHLSAGNFSQTKKMMLVK